jgi:hypothetical protein
MVLPPCDLAPLNLAMPRNDNWIEFGFTLDDVDLLELGAPPVSDLGEFDYNDLHEIGAHPGGHLSEVGMPIGTESAHDTQPCDISEKESQQPREDKPAVVQRGRRKVESRWACMECGAFVGKSGTDHAHIASCSGQEAIIKVRVHGNEVIEYPAMNVPTRFLWSE